MHRRLAASAARSPFLLAALLTVFAALAAIAVPANA
ncbi:MAG: hypothetical protein JWM86_1102, partial [Thermoleophilia bacterium]|nr:hypothetical protein [Thermoleophilia bacterium]